MDGAWTGHPDQNEIAVAQFPYPNQIAKRPKLPNSHPDLRPIPKGVGATTLAGTRAAVRTVIRYRNGVLNGKGASLLDGYMEDLATDRIYRLMIAQRVRHKSQSAGRRWQAGRTFSRLGDTHIRRGVGKNSEEPAGRDRSQSGRDFPRSATHRRGVDRAGAPLAGLGEPIHASQRRRDMGHPSAELDYAAGGRIVITRMSVSLIRALDQFLHTGTNENCSLGRGGLLSHSRNGKPDAAHPNRRSGVQELSSGRFGEPLRDGRRRCDWG